MTGPFVEVVLRRVSQALEEPDPLRRLALLVMARADLGATIDHAMVAAHQASGTLPERPVDGQHRLPLEAGT